MHSRVTRRELMVDKVESVDVQTGEELQETRFMANAQ